MNTVRHPAAPTTADVALSRTVRTLCGAGLYAGEWPRRALVGAMRLTSRYDDAEASGDEVGMVAAARRLLALARHHAPDTYDAIHPPLARAA